MMHDGEDKLRYSLSRTEILRKKKLIEELFANGSSFFIYPYKFYYLPNKELSNNQVLFSVSKKYHRNAVDRNKIKRRLREAYRLNKHILRPDKENLYYCMAIVYISKLIMPYSEIESKLIKVLRRFKSVNE